MTNCQEIRTIRIAEWCALAKHGAAPPVTIYLEGSSMMPLIRRGKDPVTIIPLQQPLRIGDVVLMTTGAERYVVHRIWKISGESIQTLGDNCVNPDPWIKKDDVLGQVVCYSRNHVKHRLDTSAARLWGRVWMTVFPIRKHCIQRKGILYQVCRKLYHKYDPEDEENE